MKFRRQSDFAALIGMLSFMSACAWAANDSIYLSRDPDGTPRYSSQPYDESYNLYIKWDSPPAKLQKANPRDARAKRNQVEMDTLIRSSAGKHGLDPDLVRAMVEVESSYNPVALSPKGAMGPMQLIPATAARYGVANPGDPQQNIDGGVRYLKDLIAAYNGNVALALAAYNSGERAVSRHGSRIPPFRETMLYVPTVLARYEANKRAIAAATE